jgi:hypothetical protein
MSFKYLKKGKEAEAAMQQADEKAAQQKAAAAGSDEEFLYKYRFWMPNDTETMITFLDGNLNENGVLDEIVMEEHQLQINGKWNNFFPCTCDTEPCPLCASPNEKESKKSHVALFTVIDHGEWTDSNGKVHRNERKLYAVKRDTLKLLRKQAVKRGGLAGCTFEVSRTGDRSASVGSHFDFVKKWDSRDAIAAEYGCDTDALNYEDVIQYRTAEELIALGLGTAPSSIGSETAPTGEAPDLSTQL